MFLNGDSCIRVWLAPRPCGRRNGCKSWDSHWLHDLGRDRHIDRSCIADPGQHRREPRRCRRSHWIRPTCLEYIGCIRYVHVSASSCCEFLISWLCEFLLTNLSTATSVQVSGRVYAASYNAPTPGDLTTAVTAMQAAYTAAMGETPVDFSEYQGGALGGSVLIPGIYKFSTTVNIATDLTLTGTCDDIYVFQIASVLHLLALNRSPIRRHIVVLSRRRQVPTSPSLAAFLPAGSFGQSRTPYQLVPQPTSKASFLRRQMLL